jgi:superfamily II DNA or RNA helicase
MTVAVAPETFAIGSLVRARQREWVVLPGTTPDLVLVRPVGGTVEEDTGILPAVEPVVPASFNWPSPDRRGDALSATLLRESMRLGFRSSAGPFRSFGSLGVEPRGYQLTPLLMALRQDPIRLLIADAAGIGKTIEAGLIVAESLATGVATGLAVLCPPHLADQWKKELASKFHLHAELVLPSTAARLERSCLAGQSLFEVYPHVIVSTDFIKSDRRREEFLRSCPDLVVVDEAHTCAADDSARSTRHQRYELIKGLGQNPRRHLVLVTGTPDSGKLGTFRSLLGLLDPSLAAAVDTLEREASRIQLAAHYIQRRRADIDREIEDTPFPERFEREDSYDLTPAYRALMQRALAFARETVQDASGGARHQRVRWWSALALLRSMASSPLAAAATLRTRAGLSEVESVEDIDALGRNDLLDLGDDNADAISDLVPGADADAEGAESTARRRLLDMAREAERLATPAQDAKLAGVIRLVDELLRDGFNPIVFARYIPTAEYVATHLRAHLGARAEVIAVSGNVPPAERETRIASLSTAPVRVLVATDCLSEGINLQEAFDAVIHYDLAWAPTKHEQREARVSRFNQKSPTVRILTYFGRDNQIDGIVLNVLLRKHKAIRDRTGVAISVPQDSGDVMEAILEGLLLRGRTGGDASQLALFDGNDEAEPRRDALHGVWEDAAERESRSRSRFAQHAIKIDEVQRELIAARTAVGGATDVETFVRAAVRAYGGTVTPVADGAVRIDLSSAARSLTDVLPTTTLTGRFDLSQQVRGTQVLLTRSHPFVESLSTYVLTTALDGLSDGAAARAAVTRTAAVARRTTLLVVRYRFDVMSVHGENARVLLAEDADVVAFEGAPSDPVWLDPVAIPGLLAAVPMGEVAGEQAASFLQRVLDERAALTSALNGFAEARAAELLATHRRVRTESGRRGMRYRVTAHTPPDVLGLFVLLPGGER